MDMGPRKMMKLGIFSASGRNWKLKLSELKMMAVMCSLKWTPMLRLGGK